MSPDGLLICAAAFARAAAVGLLGVILAIFLGEVGLSIGATGLLIGVGLSGGAVMTAAVALIADRIGRRRTLLILSVLTALGYVAIASTTRLEILLPIAFVAMLNGMGRDRGPAAALEQAMLPATVADVRRTWTLAWYNLTLDAAHAAGALGGAIPALLASRFGYEPAASHRIALLLCAAMAASSAIAYGLLSPQVEIAATNRSSAAVPNPRARTAVRKLALLFGLDSLGGGFLSSALVSYWFFHQYGLSENALAVLFFTARILNAASHVAAAWLAHRIGLLNTMVLTHLPSSVLLMAAPAAASGIVAAALFLGREALVEMDVPTRQSYVMAIVPPHDRTFASGATNLTRTAGWAAGSALAGSVMQHIVLAGPLFIGGALKIAYDLILYASFRSVRTPEERRGREAWDAHHGSQ